MLYAPRNTNLDSKKEKKKLAASAAVLDEQTPFQTHSLPQKRGSGNA
jgi:hypothetical protein